MPTPTPKVVRVNRQRILVRGGGWSPDLLLRATPQRSRRQLLLTRDLGLNAIRLEGKLQDASEIFPSDLAGGLRPFFLFSSSIVWLVRFAILLLLLAE